MTSQPVIKLQELQANWLELDNLIDIVATASYQFEAARKQIYRALLFRDSPTWTIGLSELRTEFEEKSDQLVDVSRVVAQENPALANILIEMESSVKSISSDLHDALTKAIGDRDGGAALEKLATMGNSPVTGMMIDRLKAYQTDHLARDTRYQRERLYIGIRCNDLEADGIKSIREQWRTIYHDLKRNQARLTGDSLAAWDYFQRMNPHQMTGIEKREFEKEISYMKRKTANIRQTSDKQG